MNFEDSTASGLALPYSRDWCSASFVLKPTEETHCISPCNYMQYINNRMQKEALPNCSHIMEFDVQQKSTGPLQPYGNGSIWWHVANFIKRKLGLGSSPIRCFRLFHIAAKILPGMAPQHCTISVRFYPFLSILTWLPSFGE